MKKMILPLCLCLFQLLSGPVRAAAEKESQDLNGFKPLFDGKTLNGWHRLPGHDQGKWEVKGGVIAGGQEPEGKGGLLVTDAEYSDYELYAEILATYPLDTGLFLRIRDGKNHYQVTIDYRPTGEVGALYGPWPNGGGGFFQHCLTGFTYWKPDSFNRVLVRVEGAVPRVQVWLNGVKINDFQDWAVDGKPRFPQSGPVGIQVHPGESWGPGSRVEFRNLMIKPL